MYVIRSKYITEISCDMALKVEQLNGYGRVKVRLGLSSGNQNIRSKRKLDFQNVMIVRLICLEKHRRRIKDKSCLVGRTKYFLK